MNTERLSKGVCLGAGLTAMMALGFSAPAMADTLVVANKGEATVSLIALESGEVVATLPTGEAPHEVGLSQDGKRALITNYGNRQTPGSTMTLIEVPTAKVLKTIDLGEFQRPHGVVWLAGDERVVVTAEANKALLVVDVEQGKVVSSIDTGQEISHMVAVTPNGSTAFVTNIGSGSISMIDLVAAERRAIMVTGDGAEGVAVTADGRQVWITNRAADDIWVLDTESLEPFEILSSPGFPIRATATGTKVLVTRAKADDLVIYDTEKLGEKREISLELEATDTKNRLFGDRFGDSSVPIGVVADSAGERAWVAHANADAISEVNLEKGEIVRRLKAGREPDGMAYSELDVSASAADAQH
ncbi:MAG: cytochrome D1 domain-containing protein [Acidobacteriota bacterium]